jgi:hypothetical protein
LGKSGEIVLGIDADHRNMCKFSGGKGGMSTYEQVLFHLLRMAKKAGLPRLKIDEPSAEVNGNKSPVVPTPPGQQATEIPNGQVGEVNSPESTDDKKLQTNGA